MQSKARLWFAGMILVMTTAAESAPAPDNLASFLATYECTVGEIVARVHASRKQDDRYFVLTDVPSRRYVQCLLYDHDRKVLCEAASGWWDKKSSEPDFKPDIAPSRLQALAKLGFSLDASRGNFRRYFRFRYELDYEEIARVMLSALYSGYGARVSTGVLGEAPYAMHERLLPKNRCIPVS